MKIKIILRIDADLQSVVISQTINKAPWLNLNPFTFNGTTFSIYHLKSLTNVHESNVGLKPSLWCLPSAIDFHCI